MSEFDRLRERVRQTRTTRLAAIGRNSSAAPCAEERLGCTFAPGVRVFDRVTGEWGEVVGGTRENVVVSTPESGNR